MIIMTYEDQKTLTNRLKEIIGTESTEDIKNERLANLMTDLERAYQIPGLLANVTNVDPVALSFYRMVSAERSF